MGKRPNELDEINVVVADTPVVVVAPDGSFQTAPANTFYAADGNDGWAPILAVVTDGARRVLQVVDWTGGEGSKPSTSNQFIGAAGIVGSAAAAVDIRGATGAAGAAAVDGNDGWSPILAVVTDSARRVLQIVDWTGGEGSKPSTSNQFIGASGIVGSAAAAVDIRGAAGAAGSNGTNGANASLIAGTLTFSSTTSAADPGAATFRLNNANAPQATHIYIDDNDAAGDIRARLSLLLASNVYRRTEIRMYEAVSPAINFVVFKITAITLQSGYVDLTVVPTNFWGNTPWSNTDSVEYEIYSYHFGQRGEGDFAAQPLLNAFPGFFPVKQFGMTLTADTAYHFFFYLNKPILFQGVRGRITSARTGNARMLLYKVRNSAGFGLEPDALLASPAASSVGSTGDWDALPGNLALEPGWYDLVLAIGSLAAGTLTFAALQGNYYGEAAVQRTGANWTALMERKTAADYTSSPPSPWGGAVIAGTSTGALDLTTDNAGVKIPLMLEYHNLV